MAARGRLRRVLRRAHAPALIALLALACGGKTGSPADAATAAPPDAALRIDASPPDARIADAGIDADPLYLECLTLRQRWAAIVSRLDTTCSTAQDCTAIGKNASCAAQPMLASRCDGDAVTLAAYAGAAELQPIADQFRADCLVGSLCAHVDLGCVADCAPAFQVGCVHATCVSSSPSCLLPPADAGP